ncbi:hypothetical protein PPERSA_11571 [Pseudocohnilembus persalinus]|uniref:Polycystin domain-containing protein n=1 Tax=Pseudocohnilembus persalinus TaxID=266149 RepID=A0A0V0Q9Z3_PSEPJ|nr:hypothetical protein PPERSA_11571 [Pseudocohnilembus persalinus]|eukprot:KRW98970.1 hypothetical protein PPERSA_11571 [Pseudocohnilembus persalinus]
MYNDIHNIKELDQIYKKNDQEIFQLQKENDEISEQLKDLEFQINHLDHNIKFKNQQIHGFENQIQEQQFDISQEQSIQQQNESKNQKQLKQQIKNDLERYLKLHYKQQKKDYLDRKLQQENLVKLELNSVAVYFFKGQNPTYSRYAEFKKKQFKPLVQTFSISKITTLKQIQEEANEIWKDEINEVKQLKKQKNLKFQLYDVNMVCLDLVLDQTVEQFFILNKDQQQYASLALMAKNTRQEQILDRQAQAIKIAGENQINNQRIDPEVQQMRNLHNLFQKIVKFMPGLFLTEIKVKFSDEFNFNDQLYQDQIYSQILADLYQIEISEDGESQYLRYYDRQYIGKIRVLQSRVKENECLIDIGDQDQEFKCSYIKYTDETKFKKYDDEYDFNIYRDKEYTKIHRVDSYVNSDFDGSGYVFDINPYQTKEQLQEKIDVLVDQDWINYQTSLIVVAINLYDINRNQFQLLELILQITKNETK